MIDNVIIPCPVCKEKIHVNTKALLTGAKFSCVGIHCNASIELGLDSKCVVEHAIKKFEDLKTR